MPKSPRLHTSTPAETAEPPLPTADVAASEASARKAYTAPRLDRHAPLPAVTAGSVMI